MNLIRSLIEALNPCVHQWEKIDLLHDDPEDPSITTIIRMCMICGIVDNVVIQGPPKKPKPHICPPHKWETFHRISLVDNVGQPANKQSTYGYKLLQSCVGCGETRSKVVGLSPRMMKKFGYEDEPEGEPKDETKAA